jgi:hypothetical protein
LELRLLKLLIFDEVAIAADTTLVIDLKQVLVATEVIDGGASAVSQLTFTLAEWR